MIRWICTVFLPNLSHQRRRTVSHSPTIDFNQSCDQKILSFYGDIVINREFLCISITASSDNKKFVTWEVVKENGDSNRI